MYISVTCTAMRLEVRRLWWRRRVTLPLDRRCLTVRRRPERLRQQSQRRQRRSVPMWHPDHSRSSLLTTRTVLLVKLSSGRRRSPRSSRRQTAAGTYGSSSFSPSIRSITLPRRCYVIVAVCLSQFVRSVCQQDHCKTNQPIWWNLVLSLCLLIARTD